MSKPEPSQPAPVVAEVDRVKKYDTVVSSGQSALRALLTMNGGAIIVALTLLGHLLDKPAGPPLDVRTFVAPLSCLVGGIFWALLAYCAIFVTNCFSVIDWRRSSDVAMVITFIGGFGSLSCFSIGSWLAIDAFRTATVQLVR